MQTQQIVLLCVGAALFGMGLGSILSEGFARWVMAFGVGRIWWRILGEKNALRLQRYFFGPLTLVVGLLVFLMAFVPSKAS